MKFNDIHKAILDSMGEGVYVIDEEMVILYANPAAETLTGYTVGESIGRKCRHIFCEESFRCEEGCPPKRAMQEQKPILHKEAETRTKEGEIKQTQISFSPFYEQGECLGTVIVIKDVTELRQAEERVKQQNLFLNTIINAIPNPFYVIDPVSHRISMANKAACPGGVPEGATCHAVTHRSAQPCRGDEHPCPVREVLRTGRHVTVEHVHYKAGGACKNVEVHAFPVFDDDNRIAQVIEYSVDISERKLAERRLKNLAYSDTLTGLANRALFFDRASHALAAAKRNRELFAVLFLDLDRFKAVNDRFGHEIGDRLLVETARRLDSCVREMDTVARMGGDEFAVILSRIASRESAVGTTKRIIASLSQPFALDGVTCAVGVSIGMSLYPSDGDDIDTLLKKADTAMYEAKEEGDSSYRFCS